MMLTEDGIKSHLTKREAENAGAEGDVPAHLQPLRMELFSKEQRHERGRALAQEHHCDEKSSTTGDVLLKRLHDNEDVLRSVHRLLVDDVTVKKSVTSLGEWLVDNFYVIEEQISLAYRHLPRKYLLELPSLDNPGKEGLPRVYDLAEHMIAYGDSRVDVEDVSVVLTAYQNISPLKLGELWAIPIMIRLALIENIRRIAVLTKECRDDRERARQWAEAIIKVEEKDPKNLILTIADMARNKPRLNGSFVAELKRRLQGRGAAMKLPLQWIEQNLNERGLSVDQLVSEENHIQTALEISLRNCIGSLRSLNVTDWNEFVETMSMVERILRRDPADVYGRMDFSTRDDYRRTVERFARRSDRDETSVATAGLEMAREGASNHGASSPRAHIGYYLVGNGERDLRQKIGYRTGFGDFIRHASTRLTLGLYLGTIFVLTAVLTIITASLAYAGGVRGDMLLVLTLLLIFAMCHLAVGVVNLIATQVVKPRPLPRMNFRKGIPAEMRTMVVVPVLLTSESAIGEMLRNLETHYLNNRGHNVHFALLTDLKDSAEEELPDDAGMVNLCRLGIMKLNDKYPDDGGDNFLLFHRARKWNPVEKMWMGWERKRGKLEDLNRYLLGEDLEAFSCVEGRTDALSNVRYVITLDADTTMARDSAWQMVGAMAHPLSRPQYDETLGRVVAGHGILQPRVDSTLSGANKTHYARMSASEIGIDPYTRASSDVYQDLFDEGSFIGKGIYDVEIFNRALGGRFPDNKILSHDLLEGCVIRSGLLSDVKLYEDPPQSYLMDIQRRHRWIRGDWQIASYLVTNELGGDRKGKPLNILSQWKVFDNLRRSLTPIGILLLLVLGLTVLRRPELYLLVVTCVFLVPVIVAGLCGLVRKSADKTVRQHLSNCLTSTVRQAGQMVFKFSCLPFEAHVAADAIIRSVWRQCVSHTRLLQWNPSDNRYKHSQTRFWPTLARMWIGPVAAVAMTVVMARQNHPLLLYAAPLFLLWMLSPLFVSMLSKKRVSKREELSTKQRQFLRLVARRTWLFFERFVDADENWLPPDNFQENPVGRIAHRTSPTNMGLSLLANLSAHDFGFITTGTMLHRLEKGLESMTRLPRFRGHFYNWYDTQTLDVLRPMYVSTVDSGNLAAHLLVVASGLRGAAVNPVVEPKIFHGLRDAVMLAVKDTESAEGKGRSILQPLVALADENSLNPPDRPAATFSALTRLADAARRALSDWDQAGLTDVEGGRWLKRFDESCRAAIEELEEVVPWAEFLAGRSEWAVYDELNVMPNLIDAAYLREKMADAVAAKTTVQDNVGPIPDELCELLERGGENARQRLVVIQKLLFECETLADIDFDFLYDKSKKLLAIGFNVDEHRLDNSFYDLLASEARLATYIGVVQHKIPQDSWFALGRLLTLYGRRPLLVSWSGSMFEYLMPLLVMPSYEDTLLDETYKACVEAQIQYGNSRNVPWGISESGYYVFDSEQNYQYRAFGVPELGLKHALAEDLVIAPYASVLASMVFPEQAARNIERMESKGFLADYGFYEAVDYTAARMPHNEKRSIIRSFMAHHQGMSLVALGQTLLNRPMHRRFNENPLLQSASLLLQEMAPAERAMYYHSSYSPEIHPEAERESTPVRVVNNPSTLHPEIQLLSNGNYHVMVTAAGGGYSRWRDLSLTRWREDATADNWGAFCYLRDRESGKAWSNTYQPMGEPSTAYAAIFTEGKAEFHRRDGDFDCHTEIVVAPEDDVEVRRLRITNRSGRCRLIDVTSYAEVVLNDPAADDSHQAFSKLFIQTRIIQERQAIVCGRRPRDKSERMPLLFHLLAVRGTGGGTVSYETDRLAFLGRGNDASNPEAILSDEHDLRCGEGAVLDPVVAIRSDVSLEAGETVIVDLITGVAENEEAMQMLLEKYQDQRMADKAIDMAWTHGQLLLRQLNVTESEAQLYTQFAGSVVYENPAARADPVTIMRNRKGQSSLWGYALSGDLPIVLLKITDPSRMEIVNQMIRAHAYWKEKGLKVDLMIWNEDQSVYRQSLHEDIMGLAGAVMNDANLEQPGGIFVRSVDRISEDDRILIQTVARIVLNDTDGMLDGQMRQLQKSDMSATLVRYAPVEPARITSSPVPVGKLMFFNGYGGFNPDGTEYVIVTDDNTRTPLPWVNVLANEDFGCVVSESGSSYTWSENAHEHRLTPWKNDPVSDTTGEAIYIRDEQTGAFWSPTPAPRGGGGQFVARHGFGYSVFEHSANGIKTRLTMHVDKDSCVKFYTLAVANQTNQRRNLSATAYVEWVLGDLRAKTKAHVVTGIDSRSGALMARNQYSDEFRNRTAFLDADDPGRTVCGDRKDFLGRNGSVRDPFAMHRPGLSGRVGPGLDPCGAVQVKFALAPGQEREVVFRMGAAQNLDEARKLVKRFQGNESARASLEEAKRFWKHTLGTITVDTPDTAFNFMANGWLLYQALACRLWGRSATYQSGGAFGFRDQLQDSMALVYAEPSLVRHHLLECASRQFPEGDVQHWWHPPAGRGVRTQCSDDYLWLPYVAERYVTVTGDTGVFDEKVRFIEGRPLKEDEESYYDLPARSDEKVSLYEHCRRSIRHGLLFGEHGLPLIGSGDWNDGMDRIGRKGKGESVWLGFFLYTTLQKFAPIAESRGDGEFARECLEQAETLRRNIEKNGWDDEWYRRAYFDDGTPLGSALNDECRIDVIAQSWSVISGAGDPERSRRAMQALDEQLVDHEAMIVKLLTPAFDKSDLNPGYIKGYVPGVRENGGQYTHGAIWSGFAYAELRDRAKTWEIHRILNPINHALTKEWAERYMVEPYVVAADVYSNPQHRGRGGWTWYTGSASWLYRFMIEEVLGLDVTQDAIRMDPCVPDEWDGFSVKYRRRQSVYDIRVKCPGEDATAGLEPESGRIADARIEIADDDNEHKVELSL